MVWTKSEILGYGIIVVGVYLATLLRYYHSWEPPQNIVWAVSFANSLSHIWKRFPEDVVPSIFPSWSNGMDYHGVASEGKNSICVRLRTHSKPTSSVGMLWSAKLVALKCEKFSKNSKLNLPKNNISTWILPKETYIIPVLHIRVYRM